LREFRKLGFWNRASQRERETMELLGNFAKHTFFFLLKIPSLGPGFYLQTNEKKRNNAFYWLYPVSQSSGGIFFPVI